MRAFVVSAAVTAAVFSSMPGTPVAALADAVSTPPVVTMPSGQTLIDDIGLYGVSYHYLDGRTGSRPTGWSGHFDDQTGISVTPYGSQNGKNVFLMHPIWHDGTGDTDQVFRLKLPASSSIALSFSISMETDVVGKSDGATFRVFVNGSTLLDFNKTDAVWSDHEYDLSQYSGQTITLTFEIDPGPSHNSSWDYAFWGDRAITCSGGMAQLLQPMFSSTTHYLDAPVSGWNSASPTHAVDDTTAKHISMFADMKPSSLFSGLTFCLNSGSKAQTLPFASGAHLDLVSPDGKIVSSESSSVHATISQTVDRDGVVHRHAVYMLGTRTITANADISRYDGSSTKVTLRSNDPFISTVYFGGIGPSSFEHTVLVPYYGSIKYLRDLGLFSNVALDYGLSYAGRQDKTNAYYDALTDGTRIPVSETAYYAVSPNPDDVVPTPIGSISPYRTTMANIAVIDYWGGDAAGLSDTLSDQNTYGLSKYLVIIHNWQHGGYDQQLPSVLPANDFIGGNSALRKLSATTKTLGELLALHENYVDFYPNGPLYNQSEIAVTSDGKPIPAWMWPGHISFLMTPVVMHKYASSISSQVHEQIGTTASYLDVHSSIPPFIHTDHQAARTGSGKFQTMIVCQRDLWQLMRDIHKGPVLGEGNNHWYWSGMLDGVEAQFGTGVAQDEAEWAPLFVDFDLLKIHPRQINHGMGYLERWLPTEGTAQPTVMQLDDYRMQEIAFGHSAFISNNSSTLNLPFMWQEHNLVIPVASKYAKAKVRSIEYEVDGHLLSSGAAIAAGCKFDRVKIGYDNGLTIWCNSRAEPWKISVREESIQLPQFGWAASGNGLIAYTASKSGGMASFVETPGSIFADARTVLVAEAAQSAFAAPSLTQLRQTTPNSFEGKFIFDVTRTIPAGYVPFVHVVNKDGEIISQTSTGISSSPSTWPLGKIVGDTIVGGIPVSDGIYEIRVGLYSPGTGDRLPLDGNADEQRRYRAAEITVSDGGKLISFSVPKAVASEYAPASHMVKFGVLSTNGSVKLTRIGPGEWLLIPLPRDHTFTVNLDARRIDHMLLQMTATPIDANHHPLGAAQIVPIVNGHSRLVISLPTNGIGYLLRNKPAQPR
jgi:hypothetical protein